MKSVLATCQCQQHNRKPNPSLAKPDWSSSVKMLNILYGNFVDDIRMISVSAAFPSAQVLLYYCGHLKHRDLFMHVEYNPKGKGWYFECISPRTPTVFTDCELTGICAARPNFMNFRAQTTPGFIVPVVSPLLSWLRLVCMGNSTTRVMRLNGDGSPMSLTCRCRYMRLY